jgi:hypothetical protein
VYGTAKQHFQVIESLSLNINTLVLLIIKLRTITQQILVAFCVALW